KPAERFQSAREVADVLAARLADLERVGTPGEQVPAAGRPKPRWLVPVAAGLLAVTAVVAGVLALGHWNNPAPDGTTDRTPGAPGQPPVPLPFRRITRAYRRRRSPCPAPASRAPTARTPSGWSPRRTGRTGWPKSVSGRSPRVSGGQRATASAESFSFPPSARIAACWPSRKPIRGRRSSPSARRARSRL